MSKKAITRKALKKHLSICLNREVRGCGENPTTIFRGCPEIAQLVWRVLDRLGLGLEAEIIQGKALTFDGKEVDHIWVEIPKLDLRVETNPSQILGWPTFVEVLDISEFGEQYGDGFVNMELLDRVTPAGEKFYRRMADDIVHCMKARK